MIFKNELIIMIMRFHPLNFRNDKLSAMNEEELFNLAAKAMPYKVGSEMRDRI